MEPAQEPRKSVLEKGEAGSLTGEAILNLNRDALSLLKENTREHNFEGRTHRFTIPSAEKYVFQWFWDSCFHAMAWANFDVPRAQDEIRALISGQNGSGLIPHIIYWDQSKLNLAPWSNHWSETQGLLSFMPFAEKPRTSELIQPPVIAEAVQRVYKASSDKDFLREVLPSLNRHYRWLKQFRDLDGEGLIKIVAPYESGIDSSPAYDAVLNYTPGKGLQLPIKRFQVLFSNSLMDHDPTEVMRQGSFHVADVLVNALYARNLQVLSDLNSEAGGMKESRYFENAARDVQSALITFCWDDERGAFFNLNGRDKKRSDVLTIQSLMPIVIPTLPRYYVDRIMNEHLLSEERFLRPFSVPSVAASEPTFQPDSRIPGEIFRGLWRGSSWVNTNYFIAEGASQHGYDDFARKLALDTIQMVRDAGFYEYFNTETGEGLGAKNFGWSTLAVEMVRFLGGGR